MKIIYSVPSDSVFAFVSSNNVEEFVAGWRKQNLIVIGKLRVCPSVDCATAYFEALRIGFPGSEIRATVSNSSVSLLNGSTDPATLYLAALEALLLFDEKTKRAGSEVT